MDEGHTIIILLIVLLAIVAIVNIIHISLKRASKKVR